jgi:hypothetical protein
MKTASINGFVMSIVIQHSLKSMPDTRIGAVDQSLNAGRKKSIQAYGPRSSGRRFPEVSGRSESP